MTGLLRRLARDTRGGTYILFAAVFFPLLAMIGSGIDMSRGYMAQTRLQQACDAAALAGRRAMTDGTVDNTVRAEARKFFTFNFPIGADGVAGSAAFGATGFVPVVGSAAGSATTVTVTASSVVPTSIMRLFGFVSLPISVKCNAKLDFVNTDIVLVLDTTGSMAARADPDDDDTKIVALRKAVLSFYDTLAPVKTQLENAGLRMRFAVVPYASSINMGRVLRGVSTGYVVNDNWDYQSRAALYQHIQSGLTSAQCTAKTSTTGSPGTSTSNRQGSNPNYTYTCTWYDESATGGTTNNYWGWNYHVRNIDISGYATGSSTLTTTTAGSSVAVPTRQPGSSTTAVWAGCIEERQTTNAITSSTTSIPAAAKDLNIDLVPTSDKTTKWKPYWPEVEYRRLYDTLNKSNLSSSQQNLIYDDDLMHPQVACPAEAKRLQNWTRSDLSNYLNTLDPDGGTYHDNGMVWGIRMLSGSGVFSADNPSTYGGLPVSRYLIFMTDGVFDTGYSSLYTTYGIEQWDARVTPGGGSSNEADQLTRHVNRFNLLCSAAKSRGISVWVVAFDQTLDTSLTNCASNAGQASTSANQTQLNAKFVEIGKNIGALRLTQ